MASGLTFGGPASKPVMPVSFVFRLLEENNDGSLKFELLSKVF